MGYVRFDNVWRNPSVPHVVHISNERDKALCNAQSWRAKYKPVKLNYTDRLGKDEILCRRCLAVRRAQMKREAA